MTLPSIDLPKILQSTAARLQQRFNIVLYVEPAIVHEIMGQLPHTLSHSHTSVTTEIAKIAGAFTFWVRKLKPISFQQGHANAWQKLPTVNELAAILVGAGVIEFFISHHFPHLRFKLPPHTLRDWASSYRYNAHSPHSCSLTFEMLIQ